MNSKNSVSKSEHDRGYRCVLTCLGLFVCAVIGAFLGAFILSALIYYYYVYFNPSILEDGQWGLVFLATVPIGGLIGGISGVIAGLSIAGRA